MFKKPFLKNPFLEIHFEKIFKKCLFSILNEYLKTILYFIFPNEKITTY